MENDSYKLVINSPFFYMGILSPFNSVVAGKSVVVIKEVTSEHFFEVAVQPTYSQRINAQGVFS